MINERPSVRKLLVFVLLTLICIAFSVVLGHHRRNQAQLDIFDEGAHYDYVLDIRSGRLPAWGDLLQQNTLRMADCVGTIGRPLNSCAVAYRDPSAFGAGGYDYEAQQPPLGYLPYALLARPGAASRASIFAARRGGIVWTVVAALLLLAIGLVANLSELELAALLSISLLSPVFVHAAATVSNDAAGLAAGALGCLTVLVARRCKYRMAMAGLLVGIVIGLLKGLFVVVPFVLVLSSLLAERPWRAGRRTREVFQRSACEGAMLLGSVISYLGWVLFQNHRGRVSSSKVLHALLSFEMTPSIRWNTIFDGVHKLLTVLVPYYPDVPLYWAWNIAVFAMLIGVILIRTQREETQPYRSLALGTLAGLVALAIAWPVTVFAQGHYNFAAAARYGIPLLPFIGFVVVRTGRRIGLVTVGIVLPLAAGVAQLWIGKF